MFQDISQAAQETLIQIKLDGEKLEVPAGYTVAAAMLVHQRLYNRTTPVSGSPRGPFCLMGGCFECLVTVNGTANQQACMTEVSEGMSISTQIGAGEVQMDDEELYHEL